MGGTVTPACPRCGSAMVVRRQRATGDAFYGCTRFPDCRGTIGISGFVDDVRMPKRRRPRLSTGGKYAKDAPEVIELLVARVIGRDLSLREGCLVQGIGLVLLAAIAIWF